SLSFLPDLKRRPHDTLPSKPVQRELDRAIGSLDRRSQRVSLAIPKALPSESVEFLCDFRTRGVRCQFRRCAGDRRELPAGSRASSDRQIPPLVASASPKPNPYGPTFSA